MEAFSINKHWNKFIDGEFYVSCETEDLANEFLKYCYDKGLEWSSGESLIVVNCWDNNYDSIGYKYISEGNYGMVQEINPETNIKFKGFKKETKKQPLEIMSRHIYELHRVKELCRALHEWVELEEDYCNYVNYNCLVEWNNELTDRLNSLLKTIRS